MSKLDKACQGSVALYFYRLSDVGGGAERMICQLANILAERGFCVFLITWDHIDAQSFYKLNDAVSWEKLGFKQGIVNKVQRTLLLTRVLKQNNIDVLIGFVMSSDKSIYAASKLASVKLVAAERNAPAMYWHRYSNFQRWLVFALLHLTDRITVQMNSFSSGYPKTLRKRIKIIPNPVPKALHMAQPDVVNTKGRFILLTVSRLDGVQKRIDLLIRAFAKQAAEFPDWDLHIIGDGPDQEKLITLAKDCDIAERTHFIPTTREIFKEYIQAHIFAIPSMWEGFPNALAEAMSHGLPAVGFENAQGVADLISKDDGGWLAKGLGDEDALSSALNEAMSNANERKRRGVMAAQSVSEFSEKEQYDHWVKLLNSLVSESD
jgi:GalNAc-alpha-(1->4)-GalNAc-alpha-(1->3)-diNAcBac-PP-undecaprenol alpha-1,4-N-acetyl-D-galactosaminyltransferase